MADSNPISNTISTLQSAYSLTKNLANLNEAHAIKLQISDLQSEILSAHEGTLRAQDREAALARQVNELEKRIAEMETWETSAII